MQMKVPAVFMRGGTSRALFFREEDLEPFGHTARDRIILAAMGSPDPYGRQVDGLGGGASALSKVAIIGLGSNGEVVFNFGQVEIEDSVIDWSGTCVNIAAAVGPYAIDEGIYPAVSPRTDVTVRAINVGKTFIADVLVRNGMSCTDGDYVIDGVPGSGSKITLKFLEPGGSLNKGVLPTGAPRQALHLHSGENIDVSIVDTINPTVFVRAADLNVDVTTSAANLDADVSFQDLLERIRSQAAVLLGMATTMGEASSNLRAVPKIVMVAPSVSYVATDGKLVDVKDIDFIAIANSMGKTHRTLPGHVGICAAVAAHIGGTVVQECVQSAVDGDVHIGHPAGLIEVSASVKRTGEGWVVPCITTYRTARRIMEGNIVVSEDLLT